MCSESFETHQSLSDKRSDVRELEEEKQRLGAALLCATSGHANDENTCSQTHRQSYYSYRVMH